MHTCAHVHRTPAFIHSFVLHSFVRSLVRSLSRSFVRARTHARTHTYIHIRTYIHTYIHRNSNCLALQQACATFLLNHMQQRSVTSLLLRVILAHPLAKVSDDAGAFILRSLVSACQRRWQVLPARASR